MDDEITGAIKATEGVMMDSIGVKIVVIGGERAFSLLQPQELYD